MDAHTGMYRMGWLDYVMASADAGTIPKTMWKVSQETLQQWHKEGWEDAKKREQEIGRVHFLLLELQSKAQGADEIEGVSPGVLLYFVDEILKAL